VEWRERQFARGLETARSLPDEEGEMFSLWILGVLEVLHKAQHDIRQAQHLADRLHRTISHLERELEDLVPAQVLLEEAVDIANGAWGDTE